MVERCMDCGKTWGVTVEPREKVRCTGCSTALPWRWPALYWRMRIVNLPWPATYTGSPEWWDNKTSLADLRYALTVADQLWSDWSE